MRAISLSLNLLLALVLYAASSNAFADKFSRAYKAYQKGDYIKAGELWKKAGENKVEAGDAHYNVGILYRDGLGYEINLRYAAYWFKRAAEKKHLPSMYALGELNFEGGKNYKKHINAALYWWEKAANLGDASSLFRIVELNLRGDGVKRDIYYAKEILSKNASLQKHPDFERYWLALQSELMALDIRGNIWIRGIEPDKFTVEYFQSASYDVTRNYAVNNGLYNESAIYQTIHGDFVLTSGLYNDVDEAISHIFDKKSLNTKPRSRSIRVIQAELVPPTMPLPSSWIRKLDPNMYTVRLLQGATYAQARELIDIFGLSNASIYENRYSGHDVVVGAFDTPEQALEAVGVLNSASLAGVFLPTIEYVADLQKEAIDSRELITQIYLSNKSGQLSGTQEDAEKISVASATLKSKPGSRELNRNSDSASSNKEFEWLFSAEDEFYSLQVATFFNRGAALNLAQRKFHDLPKQSAVLMQVSDDGDVLYYVVYGSYPNRKAASKAARKLGLKNVVYRTFKWMKSDVCGWYDYEKDLKSFNRFCENSM